MNDRVELPTAREVCPTRTRKLLAQGAQLVDVRELAEVAQVAFDVPGVLLLPLSELEQRFAELPRERELVLASQAGERSLKATYFLMYHGYTSVATMEGGLLKWARKGFPILGRQPEAVTASSGCCGASADSAKAVKGCCGGQETSTAQEAAPLGCCAGASR